MNVLQINIGVRVRVRKGRASFGLGLGVRVRVMRHKKQRVNIKTNDKTCQAFYWSSGSNQSFGYPAEKTRQRHKIQR